MDAGLYDQEDHVDYGFGVEMSGFQPLDQDQDQEEGEEDDDEDDWEEVAVAQPDDLEITIHQDIQPGKDAKKKTQPRGMTHAERMVRIDAHKLHTLCLAVNAAVRNRWLNDELLQARLLSLTPMKLQTFFAMIHKSRIPEQTRRGRMFETSLNHLATWWAEFFEAFPEGHIRNRAFETIQRRLEAQEQNGKGKGKESNVDEEWDIEMLEEVMGDEGELIRSAKSLMKHALMQSGSRDTSAQLFTALCRGLGLPTRLVVSLQSVPWKAGLGKPKPSGKRKGKEKEKDKLAPHEQPIASTSKAVFNGDGERLDGAPVEKSDKAKGKEKAKPVINLRKSKSKGDVLGSKPSAARKEDPLKSPPVFWTEVFSRPDGRWIPVDPLRALVNKRNVFDPPQSSKDNRMLYVLAFEEDGYARDVTRKYAKQYASKVVKVQGGSAAPGAGGKGRAEWWQKVMAPFTRPYRLNRDDTEDSEMASAQYREGMPTSLAGFKDHPLYALPRHLKQTEVLYPPPPETPELGTFRGEPVYPRSCVISLKSADTWMRTEGRTVRIGESALKMVKVRAGTIGKQRELEVRREQEEGAGGAGGAGQEVMQGLYARFQTEEYIPMPIVDGKIPKNDFGNIDLYVPSMLPKGGVHVSQKGTAKIARKLGIEFAEAVTGFEFKKRRAFPIVQGVVIAEENEQFLLDAYWEAENDAAEKALKKRREKAIKQWSRLVHGLRIRERLQEQYKDRKTDAQVKEGKAMLKAPDGPVLDPQHNGADDDGGDTAPFGMDGHTITIDAEDAFHGGAGGFVTGADDVVHKHRLPRFTHFDPDGGLAGPSGPISKKFRPTTASSRGGVPLEADLNHKSDEEEEDGPREIDMQTMDLDQDDFVSLAVPGRVEFVPKSMAELAAANSSLEADLDDDEAEVEVLGVQTRRRVTLTLPSSGSAKGKASPAKAKGTTTRAATRGATKPKAAPKPKADGKAKGKGKRKRADTDDSDVEVIARPPAKKRKVPVAVVASTRTLRPRAGKGKVVVEASEDEDEDGAGGQSEDGDY